MLNRPHGSDPLGIFVGTTLILGHSLCCVEESLFIDQNIGLRCRSLMGFTSFDLTQEEKKKRVSKASWKEKHMELCNIEKRRKETKQRKF